MRRAATGVVMALTLLLAACGGPPASGDGDGGAVGDGGADPPRDAAGPGGDDAAGADSASTTPPPSLVDVGHDCELRAVWVATVANIDFPSRTGLSAAAQKAELVALLDTMTKVGLNAIVFQVRPEGDALYRSTLEPWSRYLGGRQGADPGYDPLAFLVDEAHRRSIEVHAWFNPIRARSSASSTAVAPHVSVTHPEVCVPYDGKLWMDPGIKLVEDLAVAVVRDVTTRYDVDGIHFDDYFYPYPSGSAFPDKRTYDAYRAGGGTLALADWRRDNVNRLVRRIGEAVLDTKDHVRFGISPFGIYRPGIPAGITGLDQYAAIYADPVKWMKEGWVDYLAPQLYWPSTQTAQAYGPLIAWWAALAQDGRSIFAGNFLSKLGTSSSWSVDEFRTQVRLTRAQRDRALGNIFFTIAPLSDNKLGIADVFRRELYPRPALTPPLSTMRGTRVDPPTVRLAGRRLEVSHAGPHPLRAFVVYRDEGGKLLVDRLVPATERAFDLPPGRWAVSAATRHGLESRGVVVEVR